MIRLNSFNGSFRQARMRLHCAWVALTSHSAVVVGFDRPLGPTCRPTVCLQTHDVEVVLAAAQCSAEAYNAVGGMAKATAEARSILDAAGGGDR